MGEKEVIAKSALPVTQKDIFGGLRRLGVNEGDVVLVHVALSKLGWVCGGQHAVVLALLDAVGSTGTLVMPAHSGGNSDPAQWEHPPVPKHWVDIIYENMPAHDPRYTPTRGIGVTAEFFRTFPGTLRSAHPHLSFTAHGPLAQKITESHPLGEGLTMNSPLGVLYELGAKVLLLGANFGSCTALHLSETLCPPMPRQTQGAAVSENGERVWKWFSDYKYDCDDFRRIGAAFKKDTGLVKSGRVGNAACKLFGLREAVDYGRGWLMRNRFGVNT